MTSPSFCVLIVNYHGKSDTLAAIAAVRVAAKAAGTDARIVLVDNSGDGFLPEHDTTILTMDRNVGLAAAWRVGLRSPAAQASDYVIFLNNDAVLAPYFFKALEAGIARWGPDCAFGPRIHRADVPTLLWSRGGRISRFAVRVRHGGEGIPAANVARTDFETGHLSGCCLIVRLAHLDRIGGPDANFFFRGEEWDLNYRLACAGVRLVLLDHAEVSHRVNGSHDRFSPDMLYLAYRAKVLFAKKILPGWYFPIWFGLAYIFAYTMAAPRFERASAHDIRAIRHALVQALSDGWRSDKIRPREPAPTKLTA